MTTVRSLYNQLCDKYYYCNNNIDYIVFVSLIIFSFVFVRCSYSMSKEEKTLKFLVYCEM